MSSETGTAVTATVDCVIVGEKRYAVYECVYVRPWPSAEPRGRGRLGKGAPVERQGEGLPKQSSRRLEKWNTGRLGKERHRGSREVTL